MSTVNIDEAYRNCVVRMKAVFDELGTPVTSQKLVFDELNSNISGLFTNTVAGVEQRKRDMKELLDRKAADMSKLINKHAGAEVPEICEELAEVVGDESLTLMQRLRKIEQIE